MEKPLKYLYLHPEETLHMKISTEQKTKRQLIKQGHYSSTVSITGQIFSRHFAGDLEISLYFNMFLYLLHDL